MKQIILIILTLSLIGCKPDDYANSKIEIIDGEIVEVIYEEIVDEVYEFDSLSNCWILVENNY